MRCNQLNSILVILTFRVSNLLIALLCIPAFLGVALANAADKAPPSDAILTAKTSVVDLTRPLASTGAITPKIHQRLQAARRGDALAMFDIAQFLYHQKTRVNMDHQQQAFSWALAAARRGHGEAALITGRMYRSGYGIEQNFIKARKWLERALTRRASEPNFELALLYADALNPSQDTAKADQYVLAAIAASEPRGCLVSAKDRMNDGAQVKDVIREITCAADGGIPDAMEMLGDYHLLQRSPLAIARARTWFRKATAHGSPSASKKLSALVVQ